jgi:hypothetical protein
MVAAGINPARALRAATATAAELLGREDIGVLEPGRVADIVAMPGDPIADIGYPTIHRLHLSASERRPVSADDGARSTGAADDPTAVPHPPRRVRAIEKDVAGYDIMRLFICSRDAFGTSSGRARSASRGHLRPHVRRDDESRDRPVRRARVVLAV